MLSAKVSRSIAALLFSASLTSCTSLQTPSCAGQKPVIQELIYFGTEKPSGHVTAQEWSGFLAETVTPRFPAGLTAWQASGQWKSESGALVREPSYVLSLVHQRSVASEAAVAEIVDAYKRQFQQEAVLRVRSDACMSL